MARHLRSSLYGRGIAGLMLKFIDRIPKYLSGLACAVFCFFSDNVSRNSCIQNKTKLEKRKMEKGKNIVSLFDALDLFYYNNNLV